jgi:hypothetical protein
MLCTWLHLYACMKACGACVCLPVRKLAGHVPCVSLCAAVTTAMATPCQGYQREACYTHMRLCVVRACPRPLFKYRGVASKHTQCWRGCDDVLCVVLIAPAWGARASACCRAPLYVHHVPYCARHSRVRRGGGGGNGGSMGARGILSHLWELKQASILGGCVVM